MKTTLRVRLPRDLVDIITVAAMLRASVDRPGISPLPAAPKGLDAALRAALAGSAGVSGAGGPPRGFPFRPAAWRLAPAPPEPPHGRHWRWHAFHSSSAASSAQSASVFSFVEA